MTNYILKNNKKNEDVLVYQEKLSYSFEPKKSIKWVKEVKVLDPSMISDIWEKKIDKEYDKLLKLIYELVSSEDTESGDVLEAYTEIERIKEYLLALKERGLKHEVIKRYMNKLYVLELELKKVHVMELEEEIGRGGR